MLLNLVGYFWVSGFCTLQSVKFIASVNLQPKIALVFTSLLGVPKLRFSMLANATLYGYDVGSPCDLDGVDYYELPFW